MRDSPADPHDAPASRTSSFGAWSSVAILLVFSLLSIMDRQIIALLVTPIKHDLQLSDTQLGLLQGMAFALMYSVTGIPIGWAVDRFSRRWVIYIGITIWSLSAAYCGLARSFWQMFVGRSLVGAGFAEWLAARRSCVPARRRFDMKPARIAAMASGAPNYLGGGYAIS